MTKKLQVATVRFNNSPITTVKQDETEYVAMKPIAEGMGLSWPQQLVKLNKQREKLGCCVIAIPSNGGQQETVCIPLRKLNGWLFTINPNKVRADIRERVIQYQEECFEVLYVHWHAPAPPARVVPPLTAAQLGQIRRAVYDRAARHPQNPRSFEVKLYREIARRYHVSTYKTLPSTLAADILEFIRTFPDETYLPISEAHGRRRYDAPLRELFTADSWRQIEWMKPNSVTVTARTLLNRHGAGPVAELLKRLRADGYDVSAGEAEISALYAIVGEMDVALNRIDAIVSSALSTGQTVKL